MRALELRRHGERDPEADRLSAEGRARAPEVAPGLLGAGEEDRTPDRLAAAVSEILAKVPAGSAWSVMGILT